MKNESKIKNYPLKNRETIEALMQNNEIDEIGLLDLVFFEEILRQTVIRFEHRTSQMRLVRRAGDRVSQLVRVQDGSSTGYAAYHFPTAILQPGDVYIREGLCAAK